MEVEETGKKKINRRVKHLQPCNLKSHGDRSAELIKENEMIVKELQQQVIQIERKLIEKKLDLENAKSKATYMLNYGWSYGKKWTHRVSALDQKKMELEKLTFAHAAYRDKKAVLSFSSGEPEVNIHNLNYRMLHEASNMGEERCLLNMLNPKKHNSCFSLKELDQQIWRLEHDLMMKWRIDCISDRERTTKKLMKLVMERDQLFSNSPVKGSMWKSLPSTIDLRKQIEALETSREEKIKEITRERKKIESNKQGIRKAENELKFLRKRVERIRKRKQKALQDLSHLHELS